MRTYIAQQVLLNLGLVYYAQEKYADAVPWFDRSLKTYEKALGPTHPEVAKSLKYYASTLRHLDQIQQADELDARVKAIEEKQVAETKPIAQRALEQANRGEVEKAAKLLADHLAKEPKDSEARVLLGRILDFDGKPDEAVKTWQEGLTGETGDFQLWMLVGEIRQRQGSDGPTVVHRRGSMTVQPSKDREAEQKFKSQHMRLAVESYKKASELHPDDATPAIALARAYTALADHKAAIDTWTAVVSKAPENVDALLGLAQALKATGKESDAALTYQRALKVNPRLVEAHQALADYYKANEQPNEAHQSRVRAQFYSGLPPFSRIEYSDQNIATLQALGQKEQVLKLAQNPSETATQFLAALCWQHPHNELENLAFEALGKRAQSAAPVLRDLFVHAQSTCTIKSASHILAQIKDPEIFDRLVQLLPQDIRAVFEMDIAGALDELGDPRAVPHLVQALDPTQVETPRQQGPEAFLFDRRSARTRAALALGAFDTPEARTALEQGTENPPVAAFCHAALYRLTRDAKHLQAVGSSLEKGQPVRRDANVLVVGEPRLDATDLLATYLEKTGTAEAKDLVERWRKKQAEKK